MIFPNGSLFDIPVRKHTREFLLISEPSTSTRIYYMIHLAATLQMVLKTLYQMMLLNGFFLVLVFEDAVLAEPFLASTSSCIYYMLLLFVLLFLYFFFLFFLIVILVLLLVGFIH